MYGCYEMIECFRVVPFIDIIPHHPGNITRKQALNKTRNKTKAGNEEPKSPEKSPQKQAPKLVWKDEKPPDTDIPQYVNQGSANFNAYQHLDFFNFEPLPVSFGLLYRRCILCRHFICKHVTYETTAFFTSPSMTRAALVQN